MGLATRSRTRWVLALLALAVIGAASDAWLLWRAARGEATFEDALI